MKRKIFLLCSLFLITITLFAQKNLTFSGILLEANSHKPIEFGIVYIVNSDSWVYSDSKGYFQFKGLEKGTKNIKIRCIGFVERKMTLQLDKSINKKIIYLKEDNLRLDDVVVLAKKTSENITSEYRIDRNAINHFQMQKLSDLSALLPGGKTGISNTLMSSSVIALRSETGGEAGNPAFSTAIEVDGVRLSNNATATSTNGVDTRNIGIGNVESIEVITGIPSVEYGDFSNGIVKINTRKGKTPFMVEMLINPNTKQYSANKGFSLGEKGGVLNASLEHARSISNLASPYTSYQRNNLSFNYFSGQLNKSRPITIAAGVAMNLGGYNSKNDPDLFLDTYRKRRDGTFRANLNLNWKPELLWLTNLKFKTSYYYKDSKDVERINKSASVSFPSLHSTKEGYFVAELFKDNPNAPIINVPRGYWYVNEYVDSKTFAFRSSLKANSVYSKNGFYNNVKIGADYSVEGNLGRGVYYNSLAVAPTWREYRYDQIPYFHNVSWYAEDRVRKQFSGNEIEMSAGIRSDNSYIENSVYGLSTSFSPRFNAKFRTKTNSNKLFKYWTFTAGWGKTVKLPSFSVLYPQPGYRDILSFSATTTSDGNYYSAFHTTPVSPLYNSQLQWQATAQSEIGLETKIGKTTVNITAFHNRTENPYSTQTIYSPFHYKLTLQDALNGLAIAPKNRRFKIDEKTGIVTVSDSRGILPSEVLQHRDVRQIVGTSMRYNASPVDRWGVEWIVDFGKIPVVNTSIRLDGNYYYYKELRETLLQGTSSSNQKMSNGENYKYIGYYYGGASISNGSISKRLNTNLTFTTHIPKVRLIFSLRIESSLLNYERPLSEYRNGERGFVIDSRDSYLPSQSGGSIYDKDRFVVLYPEYYISLDDMKTKIPFKEKFEWAYKNDRELFNDLSSLVEKSNYSFIFNPDYVSQFFSANINITKEIGEAISISFNAKNFLNNMSKVKSSRQSQDITLYNSGFIPYFYYGMSLRVKL